MSGMALAQRFYTDVVAPLLTESRHAAALLGDGSEVLGFDDEISTDHNYGPRLQVFVEDDAEVAAIDEILAGALPERFAGWPVAFAVPGRFDGQSHHQVVVTTTAGFFFDLIRVDPADGMRLEDWLLTPTQRLLTLTSGPVFHDPEGWLAQRRDVLAWYPEDVWRYALAAAWLRVSQENAFVGRAGLSGDDLGSRVVAARLARDLMRLAFLIERRWAPYGKWVGRAFADLELAGEVGPHLTAALAASAWREREGELCAAARILGTATNDLQLAAAVDSAPRRYYDRDIQVVDAGGFTSTLCGAIVDPEVLELLTRLGHNPASGTASLPGAIDQAVDSTDVLTHPQRCRAVAPLLGLAPGRL